MSPVIRPGSHAAYLRPKARREERSRRDAPGVVKEGYYSQDDHGSLRKGGTGIEIGRRG